MSAILTRKHVGAILLGAGLIGTGFGYTLEILLFLFAIPIHAVWKVHLSIILGPILFLCGDFWFEEFRNLKSLLVYLLAYTCLLLTLFLGVGILWGSPRFVNPLGMALGATSLFLGGTGFLWLWRKGFFRSRKRQNS